MGEKPGTPDIDRGLPKSDKRPLEGADYMLAHAVLRKLKDHERRAWVCLRKLIPDKSRNAGARFQAHWCNLEEKLQAAIEHPTCPPSMLRFRVWAGQRLLMGVPHARVRWGALKKKPREREPSGRVGSEDPSSGGNVQQGEP